MKHILYINDYCGFIGGIERYMYQTALLLRQKGIGVSLLYSERGRANGLFASVFEKTFPHIPRKDDFDAVIVHKIHDNALLEKLIDTFGRRLAVIVHDHDYYCPRRYFYTPFGRRNCSRAYSPLSCALCGMATSPRQFKHGFIHEISEKTMYFPARFRLLHRIPHLIVLSEFMRRNLLRNGFSPDQIHLLHPAIDIPRELPPEMPHTPPVIGFIGQLIKGKGADSFLHMLALLRHPYTAVLAGDGNEMRNLTALAAQLKVNVQFTGFLGNPAEFYRKADLIVLPFRWQEPFGLVGAEAAAFGLPVAAFDLGGVREWLVDGVTGRLVPPGDVPQLAAVVDSMLEAPAELQRMKKEAREFALRTFAPEQFLQSFLAIMEVLS